ncbi:hypothetical protein BD324DRAFT_682976 [Kockovaella imperatae]|uniref:GATA-type domain-containing protein n=1 Tax=Kockovaella imperatae TaxID=4999 RepID=A0A1Y1UAL7_9TREE|nr:hypothetical protein BD324DRAFT_682976 [Kockovaella imperatae]ORX35069.1 hypothetical protein BD324DRAFT_682976 [Kockovaella imperatae]
MPPSPGKIHLLPIKVLYTIDTSNQSYVTVLQERQDVFVHSAVSSTTASTSSSPAQQTVAAGPMGSCYLKPTIRGICYASPECIPNTSKLDFSVYNLDPSLRPRSSHAFTPSSSSSGRSAPEDGSWTGKGFLSWALAEHGSGSTLIRGRLIQDEEFSQNESSGLGGLEGLMAAASRASQNNGERGWGLEVQISLKVLNPEGKDEFKGRREFEELLSRGTGLGSASSPGSSSTNSVALPPQGASVSRTEPIRRAASTAPSAPVRANGSAAMPLPPSSSSASTVRPSPGELKSSLPSSSNQASSSSNRLSLPPSQPSSSSIPMALTSSNGPPPSETPPPRQTQSPAHDRTNYSKTSTLGPPPPPSGPSLADRSSASKSRDITPPPAPRPRSPPPSTPSRKKLHDLLRYDGTMSPQLASQLAHNPMLLKLIKAIPANASAFASLNASHDANSGEDDKQSPAVETPTPSSTSTARVSTAMGCSNCGAMESELWRTKKLKDGSMKKVCNACGLYFNEFKRMRPPELWSGQAASDPPPAKKNKLEPEFPIRSSPRRHRPNGSMSGPVLPTAFESPKKRGRSGANKTPQPSPRMATRASSKLDGASTSGITGLNLAKAMEENNLFSPSIFSESPANVSTASVSAVGTDSTLATLPDAAAGGHVGEVDIEALLAQISAQPGGINLEALLGGATGADEFVEWFNSLEGDDKVPEQGHADTRQGHA